MERTTSWDDKNAEASKICTGKTRICYISSCVTPGEKKRLHFPACSLCHVKNCGKRSRADIYRFHHSTAQMLCMLDNETHISSHFGGGGLKNAHMYECLVHHSAEYYFCATWSACSKAAGCTCIVQSESTAPSIFVCRLPPFWVLVRLMCLLLCCNGGSKAFSRESYLIIPFSILVF